MGAPSRKAIEIHSILCMAHIKAASKIKPGVAAREVDMTARQVLADRGLDKYFTHSLGMASASRCTKYQGCHLNQLMCLKRVMS